jgi:adenylate cyclase
VAAGRLDTSVPVYDASEIGQLQTGFNAMAEGLRERARLQDLFGRQVGTDVARLALERGVGLGG